MHVSLCQKICVWEKKRKKLFWEGAGITADGPEGAEYGVDFRDHCRVNVYIMRG